MPDVMRPRKTLGSIAQKKVIEVKLECNERKTVVRCGHAAYTSIDRLNRPIFALVIPE